jgi:hypothetical protein
MAFQNNASFTEDFGPAASAKWTAPGPTAPCLPGHAAWPKLCFALALLLAACPPGCIDGCQPVSDDGPHDR